VPYDASDPRSQLSTAGAVSGVPRPAHYRILLESPPDDSLPAGTRTWWTRSDALVIGHSDARQGDALELDDVGEHFVLVLDGAALTVEHGSESVEVGERSVVIVPPGSSTLRITAPGIVYRLLAAETAPTVAAQCANAVEYAGGDINVAEFAAWPKPTDGFSVRVYPLVDHPLAEGRLGRIFRCSNVMVNVLPEDSQPRPPDKLSPHHHDDFEQVSLQVHGDYVHHMRVAWTPDSTTWRDDEHQHCTAPAVVVIPPPLVHTSQAVGEMHHWLIDVFAPPRFDFSNRPGWVLNADDYPMPAVS